MAFEELDDLRSIEELVDHQKGLKARLNALEAEYAGLPYPDDAREEYASLRETNDEIDRRVNELDKRQKYLEAVVRDEAPVREKGWDEGRPERTTIKERDIYDISSVRMDPEHPERGRTEYRDRAMRAIEIARFPETGVSREQGAGPHLDAARALRHAGRTARHGAS